MSIPAAMNFEHASLRVNHHRSAAGTVERDGLRGGLVCSTIWKVET